jgi:NADH-quinone oxidoreductase subunit L
MTENFPLYLIIMLPLLGAALNLLFGRRMGNSAVSLIACGAVASAALVATKAVYSLATHDLPPSGMLTDQLMAGDWIIAGDLKLAAGLMLDHLNSVLVLIVTWVALLIHLYATGYMEHEPDYARFFGYLNLFTGAMLILVLGDSLPVTFVGWEGVGLASYLLIGFWHQEDKNASAGRKAFIVNRVGDFGFLLGLCILYTVIGTLKYSEIGSHLFELRLPFWLNWPAGYWVAILLFVGCMGKSAQIPLYVWLPDAMAGPTPVSALIHAATMVTAGVYVVARTHFLFDMTPAAAQMTVAGIGAVTALFAATIGIVQRDFKKVLAYSTVSQLGFNVRRCWHWGLFGRHVSPDDPCLLQSRTVPGRGLGYARDGRRGRHHQDGWTWQAHAHHPLDLLHLLLGDCWHLSVRWVLQQGRHSCWGVCLSVHDGRERAAVGQVAD